MPEEKQLVLFYPLGDKDIRVNVGRWLGENKGQLPLEDLEGRLQQRFNYVIKSVHKEAEMRENPALRNKIDKAYRLESGIVYQR